MYILTFLSGLHPQPHHRCHPAREVIFILLSLHSHMCTRR
uniref:Uncharacterized protein n=1 Tax=Anguilla anguilla TaxID=7936 RepID=A0A0E9WH97_ANGAN